MSTYKNIDYVRRVKTYVVVFSHGGTEHKLEVPVHLNTDGTIHIEHTKNKISRWIIDYKAELEATIPENSGSIIGSTFEVNENPGTVIREAQEAEEL